ncbi:MAG: DUF1080 domain-containing protein [Chitinophagaceae bacterium]|nr:DUF1080 domain-containing protein [Chitinophagaceae bacterium]
MKNLFLLFLLQWLIHPALYSQTDSRSSSITEVIPGKGYIEPPSDAIILFDGKDLNKWESPEDNHYLAAWKVSDGFFTAPAGFGYIQTKRSFGDCQLHVEWRTPSPYKGKGQNRGNSGVLLQGLYEVQILDSYHNDTYADGSAGSIYKQHAPMVNVSLPPGSWQTYDIFFTAPVFKPNGDLEKPAYISVLQNGVLVQNHVEIKGTTYVSPPVYEKHEALPLKIQGHDSPVSFRNIWIRPLPAKK